MLAIEHIRRNVLKVSQARLADIAGTTQTTVSRWEHGEMHPRLPELTSIRDEIRKSGAKWEDAWFFEAPGDAA